ncbi:serine hydrolase [Balneolales bacterium ANBcel1]|nr:serine hydrolase [Balneolales bacterium ANBcel1]
MTAGLLLVTLSAGFTGAAGQSPFNHVNSDESQSPFSHVSSADMDSIFFAYDNPDTPGCAVGVTHFGEPLFTKGYGIANLDHGIPIRPDSRFMVASVSKQVAAAALLMLEQQGLLDLDHDLRELLPELPGSDRPITARQLMHHTSGLRDIYQLLALADTGLDNTTTPDKALDMIRRQHRFNADPGDEYGYNNTGYELIAVLVERLTGMSLDAYSRKHFFDPIGMTSTHWHDDTGKVVPNRVISYRPRSFGPGRFYRDNMDRVGPRGLFTTIEDFIRWEANFVENRSNLDRFAEKMTRPGSTRNRNSIAYASGLRLERYKTLRTVGHAGSYMGFRTQYTRFPETGLAIMVFCNQSDINPAVYSRQIADLFLRDTFAGRFAAYPGRYVNKHLGTGFDVVLKEGDLYLERIPQVPGFDGSGGMGPEGAPRGDDIGNQEDASGRYIIRDSRGIADREDFVIDRVPAFFERESRRMIWRSNDRFRVDDWDLRFERGGDSIRRMNLQAPGTGEIVFEVEQ